MTSHAPRFAGMGAHQRAKAVRTDEWLTPPEWIAELGGADSFDLDPCAPAVQPYPTARATFTRQQNGLLRAWFGRVWLNPPYSTPLLRKFMARMAEHRHGCATIFARTETEVMQELVYPFATGILYLAGRWNFHLPSGERSENNAGAPSLLIAYGRRDAEILAATGLKGHFELVAMPRRLLVAALRQPWRDVLAEFMPADGSPVQLGELYRAVASHPRAAGRRHYREKLRQELQRGPYQRVAPGVWKMA